MEAAGESRCSDASARRGEHRPIGLRHIYSNCDRLLMFSQSDYSNSITPNQIRLPGERARGRPRSRAAVPQENQEERSAGWGGHPSPGWGEGGSSCLPEPIRRGWERRRRGHKHMFSADEREPCKNAGWWWLCWGRGLKK